MRCMYIFNYHPRNQEILSKELLTICLLVSSADNLCKQIRSRSDPTKGRAWSGSNLFDSLEVLLKAFVKIIWGWKKYLQTVSIQIRLDKRSDLIWVQSVWHSEGIPERFFYKKLILKKIFANSFDQDQAWSGSNPFDTPDALLKEFFKNVDF